MECLNPVGGGKTCLKQERTHDVVDGTNGAFGLAILLGGVGAGHAESNTFGEEECASGGVIKLTTIVALDALDCTAKLSSHIRKKVRQRGKRVRLEA